MYIMYAVWLPKYFIDHMPISCTVHIKKKFPYLCVKMGCLSGTTYLQYPAI